jgi:hypothetical protein
LIFSDSVSIFPIFMWTIILMIYWIWQQCVFWLSFCIFRGDRPGNTSVKLMPLPSLQMILALQLGISRSKLMMRINRLFYIILDWLLIP